MIIMGKGTILPFGIIQYIRMEDKSLYINAKAINRKQYMGLCKKFLFVIISSSRMGNICHPFCFFVFHLFGSYLCVCLS